MLLTPTVIAAGALAVAAASAQDEFVYVKQATREQTRAASLAAYMPGVIWGDWWIIGPFDNTGRNRHDIVYPPELGIDLMATYPGKRGSTAAWLNLDVPEFDKIDLRQFGRAAFHEDVIAYLYREITADREGFIEVAIGSDDGLKFWCNGQLLIDADLYRGLDPDAHRIRLPVRKGVNTILAKVTQGAGGWDFQLRPVIDPRIEAMLEYRLNVDFPRSAEDQHYRMVTIVEPPDVSLEVGGMDLLPDGRLAVATRRGEVWLIDGADEEPAFNAKFTLFASGLHEPLGLRCRDGSIIVAQRCEMTRLVDLDGDDRADQFETLTDRWGVSGNYHEYAFGPKFDNEGRMWVNLNLAAETGMTSPTRWRGWTMIVEPDGSLTPICGGLRSPNGLGRNAAGDMFYTDNQGDWVGTNKLSHLKHGSFQGHPAGIRWYDEAGFDAPNAEREHQQPAVWFPYGRMGQSASDIALDDTGGKFGPFTGQLFVGDQMNASVMRVFLEQVDGVYQGAAFPFRDGFDCGVNRLAFAPDGSLYVGMTNRGWGSFGRRAWGVQRLVYSGDLPFELKEMRITPDGFELEFTQPVDRTFASDASSYSVASFTYHYWETYGSPEIDRSGHSVRDVSVSEDGLTVRLTLDRLRTHYVHELRLPALRNETGEPLLHSEAYYTVNIVPEG